MGTTKRIFSAGDDNTPKTPEWASRITGIPADRIVKLAREIGSAKPAYICGAGDRSARLTVN